MQVLECVCISDNINITVLLGSHLHMLYYLLIHFKSGLLHC